METAIRNYIMQQPQDRHEILIALHNTIIQHDPTITAVIEPMMGKEMIIYKCKMMKYGLSSMKQYMSLHVLPIYMHPILHKKYQSLLDKASFQKGCINFASADQMPIKIVAQLITDCSVIDLEKMREEQLKSRKAAKKK